MPRFDIYDLIGKKISFKVRGILVSGVCEDVWREILDKQMVFMISGKKHTILEPNKIEKEDNKLVFTYGSEQTEDLMGFCDEEVSMHWGEDIRKSIGREKSFLKMEISYETPK